MTHLIDFAAEAAKRGRNLRAAGGALVVVPIESRRGRESAAVARLYQRLCTLSVPGQIWAQAEAATREAVQSGESIEHAFKLGVAKAQSLSDDSASYEA